MTAGSLASRTSEEIRQSKKAKKKRKIIAKKRRVKAEKSRRRLKAKQLKEGNTDVKVQELGKAGREETSEGDSHDKHQA